MDSPSKILATSKQNNKCRRKRGKKRRPKKRTQSHSRNLGIIRQCTMKNKPKKVNISDQCLHSIIQNLCGNHISFPNVNAQESPVGCEQFERTIDLCDNSIEGPGPSSDHIPYNKPNEVVTIDLSDDVPKQKEVIDLTESVSVPVDAPQPKVIDISDEKPREELKAECPRDGDIPEEVDPQFDNDEISVIGTFTKTCSLTKEPRSFIPLSDKWSNLITCSESLKRKYLRKRSVLDKIDKKLKRVKDSSRVWGNVYVNSPLPLPSNGLRPIIIDGSNVAFVHSNCNFSCKRLEICINYFKEKGHKVTAFVPQFRLNSHKSDDPQLLRKLEKRGDVVLTPSKKIDGRNIVPYDDRFIVQTAVLQGGIIVTRDNYNDLLKENPAWAETIKYRTLAFTWVDDVLMFPKDPLGEYGPSLEQFLRFH